MSKKKNDLFDSIDDLFNTLNSEETAKAITDTVSNVGSEIKHSINESLKDVYKRQAKFNTEIRESGGWDMWRKIAAQDPSFGCLLYTSRGV